MTNPDPSDRAQGLDRTASEQIQTVTIERILPAAIWIESDIFGSRHVMLQHEGMEPFCYASFHYDYAYTSNAGTYHMAHELALSLGAVEPVEQRNRPFVFATPPPPQDEAKP